jgi:ABC-2 type transport system permease protein
MNNALIIAGRELRAYARSPIGYVAAAVTLFGEGIYFYVRGFTGALLSAEVLAFFFESASGGTMIMAAILAMRLIAGERENGTLVLLNTAPVREAEIVLGKFLAGLGFLAILALLTGYMPAMIFVNGRVSVGHIAVGYLGVILLAASSLSIALFASAVSPNQVIAALGGGALLGLFFGFFFVAQVADAPINDFFNGLAIFHVRERAFMTGVLKLDNVIYNLAVAYFFLLAATKTLEARRWR